MPRVDAAAPAGTGESLFPAWPAPPGVQALCTTRAGGVSQGPCASLNLGTHVGDSPEHVAANRQRLARAVAARPVFLNQVHGTRVVRLDAASSDGLQADACVTDQSRVACTVMVADCLPVLFCDAQGTRVGAAHCGWRGLAAGVLERTLASLAALPRPAGAAPDGDAGWLAWLGPCIGPEAFEVGPDVKAAFEAHAPAAARCLRPGPRPDKYLADLPALARQRLAALGVHRVYGNDGSPGWCTVNDPSRFFSHRRDGRCGRFAALVWRT